VTVDANMTYGQLAPWLQEQGYALHNLASLPHISVAGACSTATHGSGEKNRNLSAAVQGLEVVAANGDAVRLSRQTDGGIFGGAVVSLGALGAISKVTLEVQPTFQARQWVYENMPFAAVKAHFDEIEAAGYSVSLFTDWRNKNINEVWVKERVGSGKAFEAKTEWLGAKLAKKNLHPIAALGAENCTEQMGVPGPWNFQRRKRAAIGVFCSAQGCGGRDLRRGKAARKNQPALADHGDPGHCGGRSVAESVLPAGFGGDSFHLAAGLAGGEGGPAGN